MAAKICDSDDSQKCGMCLEVWVIKEDVRILPCQHSFCLQCLEENQAIYQKTICPMCRVDFGSVKLPLLEVAYQKPADDTKTELSCGASKCLNSPESFCVKCEKLLCIEHEQVHDVILQSHAKLDMKAYGLEQARLAARYCSKHSQQLVNLACQECLAMMCDLCEQNEDSCSFGESHKFRSLSHVANSLKTKIREQLEEIRVCEERLCRILKSFLCKADAAHETNRAALEEIDQACKDMKEEVDAEAEKLRRRVTENSEIISSEVEDVQTRFDRSSEERAECLERANQFMESNNAVLIRSHMEMKEQLRKAINSDILKKSPIPVQLKRVGGGSVEFPVKLSSDSNTVSRDNPYKCARDMIDDVLALQSSQKPAKLIFALEKLSSDECIRSALILQDGTIFLAGANCKMVSQLISLRLNLDITSNDFPHPEMNIISMCQAESIVYILCEQESFKKTLYAIKTNDICSFHPSINLSQPLDEFNCPGYVHLAATKDHLLIVDCSKKNIRVYDLLLRKHLYNLSMKFDRPWGIAPLPDGTIVVSDKKTGFVYRLSVARQSRIYWKYSPIQSPSTIATDLASQTILVASAQLPRIYVLSFKGDILREIKVAGVSGLIDICILENKILTVDDSGKATSHVVLRAD